MINLYKAIDKVNKQFGYGAIKRAGSIVHSKEPNPIHNRNKKDNA